MNRRDIEHRRCQDRASSSPSECQSLRRRRMRCWVHCGDIEPILHERATFQYDEARSSHCLGVLIRIVGKRMKDSRVDISMHSRLGRQRIRFPRVGIAESRPTGRVRTGFRKDDSFASYVKRNWGREISRIERRTMTNDEAFVRPCIHLS